jgi:predicted dehydrogenase
MSSAMPFSVALLGCGAVVQDMYVPVLKALSTELRVTHCVDINAGNSQRVAAELGGTSLPGGLDELLVATPTNGVLITLPNALHARAIVACVGQGRHVFCEKPVATRSDECDEIQEAIVSTDRVLTVNLLRRCFPSSVALRHLIQQGELGTLRRIEVAEGGRGGWQSRSGFQFVRDQSGGGVTLDRGAHVFDLLVDWCGAPELVRYADDAGKAACESTSLTDLRWANGLQGLVKLSKHEPWAPRVTVVGERGTAVWTPAEAGFVRVTSAGANGGAFESIVAPSGAKRDYMPGDGLADILRGWMSACRSEGPNPTPFAQVRVTIDLITRCYGAREPLLLDWESFPAAFPRPDGAQVAGK